MDTDKFREDMAVARQCPWTCIPIDRSVKCRFGKGGHEAEAAWDVRKVGEKFTPMCEIHHQRSWAKHLREVARFRRRFRLGLAR